MKIEVCDLNLKNTITCGQIFRYIEEDDNSYTVILPDRVVNLKQVDNLLYIESNNMLDIEEVVRKYLDLDFNYRLLQDKLIDIDDSIKDIINSGNGLKMINEPRFEVIISYIISANNGVPQIRNCLNNIARRYGKKVLFRDNEYYLFPSYKDLKEVTEEEYRDCKVGFRDKYIYEIVRKLNNNEFDIDIIDNMNSTEALEYLMSNKGIGEKVASCILLFGYHRFDVFPIDTWVKKYMKNNYNIESIKGIREYIYNKYKENCGLVIQYIFDYSRNSN
mgnify:CR=1 FL=1